MKVAPYIELRGNILSMLAKLITGLTVTLALTFIVTIVRSGLLVFE